MEKHQSILVMGVSGSGKSALSQKFNEMGYAAYDMDGIPGLFEMFDKKTGQVLKDQDNDNLEQVKDMDWICDKEKLAVFMAKESGPLTFYCGVSSNVDDILSLFDKLFLLKASPEIIHQRLTSRTNNDFARAREVQDWVMSWKDLWEDEMVEKGAIAIDADQDLDQVARQILEKVS